MSAKFLVPDDYRSDPLYNPPFSKSDDEANEKVEVLIHEHLFNHSVKGVVTGSNEDNNKIDETKNYNPTKRLGEVDYTNGRIFELHLFCKET